MVLRGPFSIISIGAISMLISPLVASQLENCEKLAAGTGCGRVVNVRAIEERNKSLTKEEFHLRYVAMNRPVVIRGGAYEWKCFTKWRNLSYIREIIGGEEVSVEKYPTKESRDFCSMTQGGGYVGDLTMNQYLDHIEAFHEGNEEYYMLNEMDIMMKGVVMYPGFERFTRDFPFPYMFDREVHRRTALFLVRSSYAQMHFHPDTEALITQMVGSKVIWLMPPIGTDVAWQNYSNLYNCCHFGFSTSTIDDERMQPFFQHPSAVRTVLHPGDQLFFPWLWWHVTWGEPDQNSISLSHFWERDLSTLKKNAHPSQYRCIQTQDVSGHLEQLEELAYDKYANSPPHIKQDL